MDDTLARASSPSLFATSTRGSLGSNQRSRSTSPSTIGTAPATPPQQPSTNLNATPRRGRRGRRKVLGLKTAHANQRGNDPFDYEQKYGEDEEFKEMGPMARIWKVFLDECGAFDSEMVEDWRDALDVLLVFAGLFSAVVTTFVSQLCQRLEADFTEINAHLMFESINIDRARAAGLSIHDVPRSQLTPFSRHRPSQTAVWVNGLWFTSLALSLTTALMAVLMKQWIHQYMSVPSGTPRDRSRIRQFRYMSLQQWQVPVIIGLLPVLMHIALGVFFAGLIVYLYSLNTVMSGVVTGIASTAFITYFLTNLLPLYKPGCPYKTPLTIHSYAFLVAVWDRVRTLTNARESTPSKEHLSLKSVEQERVTCDADAIDAQSLAWLHDVSSNSSVQRIVLQAISNLPLGPSVDTVRQTIPDVEFSILRCLRQYGTAERRYGYERLTRAFIRFESVPNSRPYPFQEDSVDNSLLVLFNTDDTHHAINFLVQQIVKPTVKLDAISWLRVFRNALADRGDWLEVHDDESVVWPAFLEFFLKGHSCLTAVHNRKEVASTIVEYFGEFPTSINRYDNFRLTINPLDNKHPDRKTTSDGIDLQRAIQEFLYPSLCDFLLLTTFTPFITRADESLPSDIRLHLALLQCPFTHVATRPITEGMLPLRRVISFIKAYVDISPSHRQTFGGPIIHHHQLPSAVFDSIYYLLTKETTSFTGRICHRDQRDLLHALFRALVLDEELRQKHEGWLADDTMKIRVLGVIFQPPQVILFPLITEVLEYFYLTKSLIGPEVYRRISKGRWFDSLRQEFMLSDPTDDFHALPLDERGFGATDYAFHFLVVAYIDGLEILETMAPEVYEQTMADIRMPSNVLTLCKVLILGDIDSRNRMWKLGKLVGRDLWQTCMMSLPDFLRSDGAKELYALQSFYRGGRRPYHDHVFLTFSPFDELPGVVDQFSMAWQWGGNFPLVTPIYNTPKQLEDFTLNVYRKNFKA